MNQDIEKPYCENCAARVQSAIAGLEKSDLGEVSNAKICNLFRKGDTIFAEGDEPAGIFCVHSGKAISKARLDAIPWAALCIESQRQLEEDGLNLETDEG